MLSLPNTMYNQFDKQKWPERYLTAYYVPVLPITVVQLHSYLFLCDSHFSYDDCILADNIERNTILGDGNNSIPNVSSNQTR